MTTRAEKKRASTPDYSQGKNKRRVRKKEEKEIKIAYSGGTTASLLYDHLVTSQLRWWHL